MASATPSGLAGAHSSAPIDLTLDDDDEDLVEAVSVPSTPPPIANHRKRSSDSPLEESVSWRRYMPRTDEADATAWICLGMIRPALLCMYGLPPELHWDRRDGLPPTDPAWTHLAFWGEPGYRPVSIHPIISSSAGTSPFLPASHPSSSLGVSTLAPPPNAQTQPVIVNEYGRLKDTFNKALEPLLRFHLVHLVSRARLTSPRQASIYSHEAESLVFTRGQNKHMVQQALMHAGIVLEVPSAYRASDYPDAPALQVPPRSHELSELTEIAEPPPPPQPPRRTQYTAPVLSSHSHVEEEQSQAQIHAIYAALTDRGPLEETEAGPLITTPLFPHQKQALTFLLDRERERHFDELLSDDPPPHISLWTVHTRSGKSIERYRHIVTGLTRRSRPTISRGAILADDMGLGKTLTVISLMAYTQPEARAFGQSPLKREDEEDDEPLLIGDSRNKRTAEQARVEELRCRSRATLLVCPLTVVSNWESQIRQHWSAEHLPDVYIYHGAGRTISPHALANHDIVITTYSTLGNEFSNQSVWTAAAGRTDNDADLLARNESPNPCQRVEWFRIVLDEAHIVKEARTWQSKAVCNLSSMRRLCLTGTPIQNRIDDLYALFVFLRLDPFVDRAVWNRFCGDRDQIRLNTASSGIKVNPEQLKRLQSVMKFVTLRRMKSDTKPDGQALLTLPPKSTRIVTLELNEAERGKYDRLHSQFREEFIGYVAEGSVGVHYATILHEILILRMMCDHAELVNSVDEPDVSDDALHRMHDSAERGPREAPAECILTHSFKPDVPSTWPAGWSTKLRALITDLLPFSRCNPASELYDPTAPALEQVAVTENGTTSVEVQAFEGGPRAPIKSVVFSQWTRMLSKIGRALQDAGIGFRQLDGTMRRETREAAIAEFHDDPKVEVFLVSLRAGGFGLNLIAGCRAYLMDPYWNPSVEQQGLDRIHRVGQTRPIVMTKFIMHQTIEEKLLELQRRKLELANQVGERPEAESKQARTEDLQFLFS